MKIDILTLFPDMIESSLGESIIGRARKSGILDINCYQIRDYSDNKQNKVDDCPYGGGKGMLMTYQPIKSCYDAAVSAANQKPYTIYMSPQGTPFDQNVAKRLSKVPYLCILCGHYEGVDERVIETIIDEEVSIGDFVLTGGEIPAMAVVDSVSRLVPGVLSSDESFEIESFENDLLEFPQYTRPEDINGMKVPEVLLLGNHADIQSFRLNESIERTKKKRPDLYKKFIKSKANPSRDIYLDNSATTVMLPEVSSEINRIYNDIYGNPSSLHRVGLAAENELTKARKTLASTIFADPSEILLTSGGSEANNTAIKGFLSKNKHAGTNIIVSQVEHPSVLETAKAACREYGLELRIAPVKSNGVIDLNALKSLIDNETALISVMYVNSETGAVNPISEIADIKDMIKPSAVLHVDAVQGYGKLPIDVRTFGADMISVSGHKIHGPRGTGFLYIKKGIRINPLIDGGGQEKGLRSGTENVAGICGFALASKLAIDLMKDSYDHVAEIRELFISGLREKLGEKFFVNSEMDSSLPYIVNISFAPLRAEVVLHSLETMNVFVSVGSACSSKKSGRSHVLTAMGVSPSIIDGSVRFSFSRMTDESDITIAIDAIHKVVKQLRKERFKKCDR